MKSLTGVKVEGNSQSKRLWWPELGTLVPLERCGCTFTLIYFTTWILFFTWLWVPQSRNPAVFPCPVLSIPSKVPGIYNSSKYIFLVFEILKDRRWTVGVGEWSGWEGERGKNRDNCNRTNKNKKLKNKEEVFIWENWQKRDWTNVVKCPDLIDQSGGWRHRQHRDSREMKQVYRRCIPDQCGLVGRWPQREGSWFWFPVRARAWALGLVPARGGWVWKATDWWFPPSLSPSLPSP